MKGLQAVSSTLTGNSLSVSSMVANGKRALKTALLNLGKPVVAPPEPFAEPGCPNFFQSGTAPSKIFDPFCIPLIESAAKNSGSLKTSGLLRTDIFDIAPVPSIQNIPAPIPPTGNAIRFKYAPEYVPLYT